MYNHQPFKSIFTPHVSFKPAQVEQTEDELVVIPKKKEQPRYLSGERLLLKLNKKKKDIDVEKIEKSLARLLLEFAS